MRKKYAILLLFCFIIGSMTFTACKKKNNDNDVDSAIVTIIPTITPTNPVEETPGDEDDNEIDPGTVTEVPDVKISDSDAIKLIQNAIGERGYYIELLDDHLNIGDDTYYTFQISDSTTDIAPIVIVNNKTGEILCYYMDGTTAPFSEFPLFTKPEDNATTNDKDEFTKEDALTLLTKVSIDTLGLPAPISEYVIVYDDWTTLVNGIDCYGINVYKEAEEQMVNMGLYYVAVDGSKMYKFDVVEDDFVEMTVE